MMRFAARLGSIALYTLAVFAPVHGARASAGVLINQIQTASLAGADQESVQLVNASGVTLEMAGYTLQYRAASSAAGSDCAKGWTTKGALPATSLASGATLNLSATGYGAADATFNPGLAAAGGTLRLLDATGQVSDQVAWGTGLCAATAAAPAPAAGQQLTRLPGPANTGNNQADFSSQAAPAGVAEVAPADSVNAVSLQITEFLPDPAVPLTDAADEFIELYNPTDEPIQAGGYSIKTGASLASKHNLPNAIIEPHSYMAFTSAATKIALANAGSSVALYTTAGTPVGATITYTGAKAGQAWARGESGWAWSATATPGATNVITAPVVAGAAAASKAAATKAKATKAASVTKKVTSKTAKAAKAAKAKVAAAPAAVASAATSPGGRWLLFAMIGLTITYCLYEFRYDLQRIYHRFRGYTPASQPNSPRVIRRDRLRVSQRPGRG